ncbi:MAG TPA: xanthine dehydrogenase family protein molybdopterin-binding subunit [Actinomycetota bacterium]
MGSRTPKVDAAEKVVGTGRYVDDLSLPGMVYARLARSPYPHARIREVSTESALGQPGVRLILSSENLPGLLPDLGPYDPACHDFEREGAVSMPGDFRLVDSTIRHVGEPVAVVVADSDGAAVEAAATLEVDYEPLPAVLDVDQARLEEAPQIHQGAEGNVAGNLRRSAGDVEAALAESEVVLAHRFSTSRQKQAQLEPTCCVVEPRRDGGVTVWTPHQAPHRARRTLARMFGLGLNSVRVVNPLIGGAFGKGDGLTAEPYAVAAALVTRRPIKLRYSRHEDLVGTEARHPAVFDLTAGFDAKGRILALRGRVTMDAGAYLSHTPRVLPVILTQLTATYRIPNVDLEVTALFTNTPVSGAFRGYGGPQAAFALEHLIDLGARAVNVDPLEARDRMRIRTGDSWGYSRRPIDTSGLEECLRLGAEAIGWSGHRAKELWPRACDQTGIRRGVGMACVVWKSGIAGKAGAVDQSGATVVVNPDGSTLVASAACDLGTGIKTTLAQICAEALGLPIESVRVTESDTGVTPYDSGAHASRSLYRAGRAVERAALEAKREILTYAADLLEADPGDLQFDGDRIVVRGAPDRSAALFDVLERGFREGRRFEGVGTAPLENAPSFAAQFAEVEVDLETGGVRVTRLVAAQDVGKAINPTIVEGQIQGAVHQGLGYALTEDLVIDPETGTVLNGSFMDYRVLTSADGPLVETIVVEQGDPTGPFGAKGAGEPSIILTAPAVANAILHATGASVRKLPMTPERVLAAIRGVKLGGEQAEPGALAGNGSGTV